MDAQRSAPRHPTAWRRWLGRAWRSPGQGTRIPRFRYRPNSHVERVKMSDAGDAGSVNSSRPRRLTREAAATMEAARFDAWTRAWTRRRFGRVAAGSLASLVIAATPDGTEAARCKKLGLTCTRRGKRCCGAL